MKMTYKWRATK